MACVLTLWCSTRQCEVTTGILLEAEALLDLAQHTERLTCAVCGREHSIKHAYLKPVPPAAQRVARTLPPQLAQRRADAH